jgi:hypothetical protein
MSADSSSVNGADAHQAAVSSWAASAALAASVFH